MSLKTKQVRLLSVLVNMLTECPNHGGSFDCTPFCPLCEGEQEYNDMKITKRIDLEADTLYLEGDSAQYFYTPNPPGVIWLNVIEADEMFGSDSPANFIEKLEDE